MTKLDIITGFLGAGKTTFINRYAAFCTGRGEKVVVLINDFSDKPIDDLLIRAGTVHSLSDGCVCCTLKHEFLKTAEDIVKNEKPDRLIFEPSGIFMLTENLNALRRIDNLAVNSVTCIVDGVNFYAQRADFAPFIDNQIAHASRIIVSKTENSTIQDAVIADIRYLYKALPITAKPYTAYTDADYDLAGGVLPVYTLRDAHPAPLCFSRELGRTFSPFLLKQIAKNFKDNRYGTVIRAKAILKKDKEGYALLNVIANRAEVTDFAAEAATPRIAVMGEALAGARLRTDFF